jgi:hypothetical protein
MPAPKKLNAEQEGMLWVKHITFVAIVLIELLGIGCGIAVLFWSRKVLTHSATESNYEQIVLSAMAYAAGCILTSMALANGATVELISHLLCPRGRAKAAQR